MSTFRKVKDKYVTSTRLNIGIIIFVGEVVIKDLLWPMQQPFIF
jgi:hypothetical protein